MSTQPRVQQQVWREGCQLPRVASAEVWLRRALTLHDALPAPTSQKPRASTARPCRRMKNKIHRKLRQRGHALGEQRGGGWKNSSGVSSWGARKRPGIGVKDKQGRPWRGWRSRQPQRAGTFCTFCRPAARGAGRQLRAALPGMQLGWYFIILTPAKAPVLLPPRPNAALG